MLEFEKLVIKRLDNIEKIIKDNNSDEIKQSLTELKTSFDTLSQTITTYIQQTENRLSALENLSA